MAFETLIVADRGATRVITVNRPDVLNALNHVVLQELGRAVEEVAAADDIRALVLTGAGEKAFVAGADIAEMKGKRPNEAEAYSRLGHDVMDALAELPVPVIAAVNGFALGGGLELALACDFIYASENAKLGLVEVNLGLIPGFGGVARLVRRIGVARAREFIYTAHIAKADEALRVGLVNRVTPPGDVVDEAVKTAAIIADKGPYAIALAKRMILEGQNVDHRTANLLEQRSFGLVFGTEDAHAGIEAFLEKRAPVFSNK